VMLGSWAPPLPKLAGAYPFTSCSASRSSFQGAFHAGRTRLILGAFTTTTQQGSPAPAPLFSLKHIEGVFIPQGGRRPYVVYPRPSLVTRFFRQSANGGPWSYPRPMNVI